MTYLVTGGTGFVGSHVCKALVSAGDKVVVLDVILDYSIMNEIMTPEEVSSISFELGDTTDFLSLALLIKKHNIEKIIHLASTLFPYSDHHPDQAVKTIVMGTVNVFEAAKVLGIKKVVWSSTVGVFGAATGMIANDHPHSPNNVYAVCKDQCEFLALHYAKTWDIDQIAIRPSVIYGPGRTRGFLTYIQKLFVEPAQGKPSVVPFGDSVTDWQYVEDVAACFVACSKVGRVKTMIYNTRGDVRSIKEARDYVKTLLPDADITLEPGGMGVVDSVDYDDSLIREEVGFVPKFNMEKGCLHTLNFYRKLYGFPELVDNNL